MNSILLVISLIFTDVSVYFSPRGGCTQAIVKNIDGAQHDIKVLAYSFTSREIADAMGRAANRQVSVDVILDRLQSTGRGSMKNYLKQSGILVEIDGKHSIAHNKVIIIDNEIVITGSFNFTKNAEIHNAENMLVIKDKKLAKLYLDNWKVHRDHSN